jgi:hypothetical protein
MTLQSVLQAVEPHDSDAAVLAEILAINSELSDLQGRVSRLAQQLATRQVVVPFEEYSEGVLSAVADAIGLSEDQLQPSSPDNMDGRSDTMESAPAIMEPPLEPAAEGLEEEPYIRIPLKHYVPASPACQKVLDLYGETTLTPAEMARQLDMNRSSVGSYLAMGRKASDPRVVKGDAARRAEAPEPQEGDEDGAEVVETVIVPVDESAPEPQEPAEPVQSEQPETRVFRRVPRFEEDEGPTRLRIPSVPAPAPKAKPAETPTEEARVTPISGFDADKIMVVDVDALKIHGPWGSVDVVRPFARSMERMVDGNTYDVDTLRDVGPWPRGDAMKDHFSVMRRKLAAIGIDLVTVNKFMFRVQRLEV